MREYARLSIVALVATGCADACPEVREVAPNVSQGGRAFAIAVKPDDDKTAIVASETGGLFRTTNRGVKWDHLTFFPSNFVHDVAYASLAPKTVIATTRSRFKNPNDGGIWRSTDGGITWAQPANALPAPSRDCPVRPSAHGISYQPLSRTVWVATDCGLSRSSDDGATWTFVKLNPNAPQRFDSLQHRVWSVGVSSRTAGVAAADNGIFHLTSGGAWTMASTGPPNGKPRAFHAIAPSPWNVNHVFMVACTINGCTGIPDWNLWLSNDGGDTWRVIPSPRDSVGREPFVRTARSANGDDTRFDVYLTTGVKLLRHDFFRATGDPTSSGPWVRLASDHDDPADVAFDLDRRVPILLGTDGGVHTTTDKGAHWRLTGGGPGGYNALQITEITGQEIAGSKPHLDLYYGTQDNDIKASSDGGKTWNGSKCCEGFFLRIPPKSDAHKDSKFTGAACGTCSTFQSKEHLSAITAWNNPPDGDTIPNTSEFEGTPTLILPDVYLQQTIREGSSDSMRYLLTLSAGASWRDAYTLRVKPRGLPQITGSRANPTVFQGLRTDRNLSPRGFAYGLRRIETIATTPRTERADSIGLGALGVLKTMFAFYTAFGVDPRNENNLIAADIQDKQMKYSRNGGRSWHAFPELTTVVTDSGKFNMAVDDEPLASLIAFDPYDSCHLIIGTHQRGILRSVDGGLTWRVLRGSGGVRYPTSVYFPEKGEPWVSSYGRGLWKLLVSRKDTDGKCPFIPRRDPPPTSDSTVVLDPNTGGVVIFRGVGDTAACVTCTYLIATDGWITNYQERDGALMDFSISGGSVSHVDRAGRERPLTIPNRYERGEWQRADRPGVVARTTPRNKVRALVLDGRRVRGLIIGPYELTPPAVVVPRVDANGGGAGANAEGFVVGGGTVRLTGSGFKTTRVGGTPPTLFVDGLRQTLPVVVRPDGSVRVDFPVSGSVGADVEIVLEQRDGQRLTRAVTSVRIVSRDQPSGVVIR